MRKTTLLEKAKEFKIPRRNCMKTKQKLEKPIKDTVIKYKEIIFGANSPICMKCLGERKEQIIDKRVYDQKMIDYTVRKLAWDGLQKSSEKYSNGW